MKMEQEGKLVKCVLKERTNITKPEELELLLSEPMSTNQYWAQKVAAFLRKKKKNLSTEQLRPLLSHFHPGEMRLQFISQSKAETSFSLKKKKEKRNEREKKGYNEPSVSLGMIYGDAFAYIFSTDNRKIQ